jgi:hypothetical protein
MAIDSRIEGPLRQMLGYAIGHELDSLASVIASQGGTVYGHAARWCIVLSGYVAIDAAEGWPTDDELHIIAGVAAKAPTGLPITEDAIYTYLSRVALGFEAPRAVFPDQETAAMTPLFATANLLLGYSRRDLSWQDYLDQILDGISVAEQTKSTALPALTYRIRSAAAHAAKQAR